MFVQKLVQANDKDLLALCEGKPLATGRFPEQRASNAESVSISWHHHVLTFSSLVRHIESLRLTLIIRMEIDMKAVSSQIGSRDVIATQCVQDGTTRVITWVQWTFNDYHRWIWFGCMCSCRSMLLHGITAWISKYIPWFPVRCDYSSMH